MGGAVGSLVVRYWLDRPWWVKALVIAAPVALVWWLVA
jgi:hypothetical protein